MRPLSLISFTNNLKGARYFASLWAGSVGTHLKYPGIKGFGSGRCFGV